MINYKGNKLSVENKYVLKIAKNNQTPFYLYSAKAIKDNGKPAIDFEIAKRQVDAIGQLTASQNTKTLVLPSDISGIFSAFSALMETLPKEKK